MTSSLKSKFFEIQILGNPSRLKSKSLEIHSLKIRAINHPDSMIEPSSSTTIVGMTIIAVEQAIMPVNLRPIPPGLLRGPQSEAAGIRDSVYYPDRRELQITFRSGRTFAYSKVPPQLYAAFLASPSPAAFFSIAIRGRFLFHELQPSQRTRH